MTGTGGGLPAAGIDVTVPSIARTYDYFLGGKDNFAVDREHAEQILRQAPYARDVALANRRFLGRVVTFLVESGIDQFLDLGAGLPSQNNVHEVAQRVRPDARVVYVDNDPVVLRHAEALLARGDFTGVICADVREPARILADPTVQGMLDFSRPIAVMCIAVLHFVSDDEDPWGSVAEFTDCLVPGSYLAVAHTSIDGMPDDLMKTVKARHEDAAAPGVAFRSREAIARFFDGLELVDPGLVGFTEWRADDLEPNRPGGDSTWMLAGVGRKP